MGEKHSLGMRLVRIVHHYDKGETNTLTAHTRYGSTVLVVTMVVCNL